MYLFYVDESGQREYNPKNSCCLSSGNLGLQLFLYA